LFFFNKRFFFKFPHIQNTAVGYLGGSKEKPSYEQVCTGATGHAEVLQLEYDEKTKLEDLVTFFFQIHDPTTPNQSGNDRGTQYRSAIFYHSDEQKKVAETVRDQVRANEKGKYGCEKKDGGFGGLKFCNC
jgi:methionine-S-sulfoxide reductase